MKKYRLLPFILVLLALTLVVSGCGLFKKTATITGTVKWSDDDTGVAGAEVSIAGLSATTNADGAFFISKVPYGEHELEVTYEGGVHTQTVVVDKKDVVVDIIVDKPIEYATVSGTLTWDDSSSITGATVLLAGLSATTGSDGGYTFADIPYGSYQLEVRYLGATVHTQAVEVDEDDEIVDISIVKPTGKVGGTLTWDDDSPIAGATVKIAGSNATSGADGGYAIAGIPYGSYQLEVEYDGSTVHTETVTVNQSNVTVDISIDWIYSYGTVYGVVTWEDGTPISGAEVTIGALSAVTEADGSYSIANVPHGDQSIEVAVEGTVMHSEEIDLQTKSMVVDIQVIRYGELKGKIYRGTNLPLAGGKVLLFDGETQIAALLTSISGIVNFAEVPYGVYTMKVYVGADELYSADVTINQAVTDLSTVYVDVVDGVIFVQDFELVEPGVFPPGHAAFGGGDGGQLDSTVSYTGSNSWVIQAVPGTGNGLRHVPVPVIPGKTYRATVYATWEGTYPCSLYLDFVDASNTRITVVSALCNLDDPYWNSVELELTAPEDAVYARVIMYYGASEQYRKTWFDDVRIIELP